MAALLAGGSAPGEGADLQTRAEDPFTESTPNRQAYIHRYSSRFDLDHSPFGAANSPTQVKKALEAHLVDTERRLQDTKTLGESLLAQQSKLQDKLREVEEQQDEAEITPELKQQLKAIGEEHDDVSREIARSLLAPKSRIVSGEERQGDEPPVYTSQASGSPTKISAPNRRQRNQPSNRTADVQFAADISVSLLAQVRALQAAVADRDDAIKAANAERLKLESDVLGLSQRLRTHDENEQRYKDENWNLETQNHELLSAVREAGDKEKRVNANLAIAVTERTRLLNELEEIKLAHEKLSEDHLTARKAHDTELHSLKRDVDTADTERATLHGRIEELTSQNQELARTLAGKYRNITPNQPGDAERGANGDDQGNGTPEHSPPPSPTKATPRHGGLESETLRSSLHHAHRQIQNLKNNIHREKTEKIELKRMLQEARDDLDQHRSGLGGAGRKQKARNDNLKRSARPDILGASRQSRTDIEMDEDNWEDQTGGVPGGYPSSVANATDMSDAYQTAHETENDFETADERNTTESEAFETGAESLAGDSSEELTETEDNIPARTRQISATRMSQSALAGRSAGNRSSYYSTASTSAGEEEDHLQTPIQGQPHRFRLRNGRSSYVKQSQSIDDGTPDSVRTISSSIDSPATVTAGRSPPAAEQSLFAELGGNDDTNGDLYNTPGRSSVISADTPQSSYTPSKPMLAQAAPIIESRPLMVDSGIMTDDWTPEPITPVPIPAPVPVEPTPSIPASTFSGLLAASFIEPVEPPRAASPSDFPLPPSVPVSPVRRNDISTQYTPQRGLHESPVRTTAFITPPKTTWDEAQEIESPVLGTQPQLTSEIPKAPFAYSSMRSQETVPFAAPVPIVVPSPVHAFSQIVSQDVQPVEPKPVVQPVVTPVKAVTGKAPEESSKTREATTVGAAGGLIAGAAAALGFKLREKDTPPSTSAASSTTAATVADEDVREVKTKPVTEVTAASSNDQPKTTVVPRAVTHDQGAQTMLTAEQIEQALKPRPSAPVTPVVSSPTRSTTTLNKVPMPLLTLHEAESQVVESPPVPAMSPNRPGSSSGQRLSSSTAQGHPPLPQDYKTNIARANSQVGGQPPAGRDSIQSGVTIMGPPLMPASAMRRPQTPGESIRHVTRDVPSRASQSSRIARSHVPSHRSRRSSVSSFASELDERFNIRPGANPLPGQYQGPATDPRMIQAITQTMIGEYLWKYTRKAGGKEMSSTRHRRYFWVHPYNKTLHWSVQDPQTAGSKEAKSKGVIIESVRVVTDDNPMPPGLHRKSLEIVTPGRKIKVTATTGQRHETWFNALSYLLLRGDPADAAGTYVAGGNEVTRDDLAEFNVDSGGYNAHLVPNGSRLSMSSYNSRGTSNTAYRTSRQALPSNVVTTGAVTRQPELQPSAIEHDSMSAPVESYNRTREGQLQEADRDRTIRAKNVSRISKMFGSVTGRQSQSSVNEGNLNQLRGHRRQESDNSIYDASVVSDVADSDDQYRDEMLQEQQGLENVRACCDGKHDVSSLTHGHHRHGRSSGALQSMTDRINRSVSRRA